MKKSNKKDADRKKAVEYLTEYIISSYFLYKVCEGCESIILEHRTFCPLCDSYNFDYSFKRISDRAVSLADSNYDVVKGFMEDLE